MMQLIENASGSPQGFSCTLHDSFPCDSFEAFVDRMRPLCDALCAEEWIMDYYRVHFVSREDAMIIRLSL